MTGRTANRSLRRAVWWSVGLRVSGALMRALCAAAGIYVGSSARPAVKLAMGRWRHGVRGGDMAIAYASGGAALLLVFAYVSAVETVALDADGCAALLRRRPRSRRRRNPSPRPRAADHAVKMNRRPIS